MRSPQVTIVNSSGQNVHVSEVSAELTKLGISNEVIDFNPLLPIADNMERLGAVTLWRSSSLNNRIQRSSVVNYLDKTYLINDAVFLQPNVAEKYYQQQTIASVPSLKQYAILTYRVKNKKQFQKLNEEGVLHMPVIAKPNAGARGEGIVLIRSEENLEELDKPIGEYVLQDFIENDGDWRVIVIGGRPIGAMKRIPQNGSFLNNISQGAHAVNEQDPEVLKVLYKLAPRVAAEFHLRFCGVDIIRNTQTGEFKILEVNTVPQWRNTYGFSDTTGVSVAEKLAGYMKSILEWKRDNDMPRAIDAYLKESLEPYPHDLFHFASRRWLWSHDQWSGQQLKNMEEWYIGSNEVQYREKIAAICKRDKPVENVNQRRSYRRKYYIVHDKLPLYNALLFRYLFARTLYGVDLRPYIQEHISDEELRDELTSLLNDHDAIRVLSTHAVNFFYLAGHYLGVPVDPSHLLAVADDYDHLVASGELSETVAKKLKIYLLTHAIIGESLFYRRPVEAEVYHEFCSRIEAIIYENYFDISLDNKLEFLVCVMLCNATTKLREVILAEAKGSVSWAGPFLVDKGAQPLRHIVQTAEHRNVLYLMATSERFEYEGAV